MGEVQYTSRAVADRAGALHYLGAVCTKHPELSGKRSARNGNCCGCNRDKMRARRASNPGYFKEQNRATYLRNRDRYLEAGRIRGRLRRTGMDEDTYRKLLALQDGKCAICRRVLGKRIGHADHCHDTKKPRGLLCSTCNQAEGLIKRSGLSSGEFGKRLAAYLAHPPAEKIK